MYSGSALAQSPRGRGDAPADVDQDGGMDLVFTQPG